MKQEVFDLLLEFHQCLIRPKLTDATIESAKGILVNGETSTGVNYSAKVLADNLLNRGIDLSDFAQGNFEQQCKIYGRAYKKKPSDGVFAALGEVLSGSGINAAASKNDVNYQSVKSLKPRFERYSNYAARLVELSGSK